MHGYVTNSSPEVREAPMQYFLTYPERSSGELADFVLERLFECAIEALFCLLELL
jgi:hypothetical protein